MRLLMTRPGQQIRLKTHFAKPSLSFLRTPSLFSCSVHKKIKGPKREKTRINIQEVTMISQQHTRGFLEDNNEACILLQNGDYDGATVLLKRALDGLKRSMVLEEPVEDAVSPAGSAHGNVPLSFSKPSNRHEAMSLSSISSSEDLVMPSLMPLCMEAEEECVCEADGDSCTCIEYASVSSTSKMIQSVQVAVAPLCPPRSPFQAMSSSIRMYNQAFMLPVVDDMTPEEKECWAIPIVFYNTALTYHCQSLDLPAASSLFYLRNALRLYELAVLLLEQAPSSSLRADSMYDEEYDELAEEEEEEDLNHLLLKTAVANNLGQCHACLYQVHEASQCFQVVRHTLTYLKQAGTSAPLPEEDYTCFFLNAFQVELLCLAPAA